MELPLFPLNAVPSPSATLPLHVFEQRHKSLMSHRLEQRQPFGVVLIRSGSEVGEPAQPLDIGTTARIARVQELAEGRMNVLSVGDQRFRILHLLRQCPYLLDEVELLQCGDEDGALVDFAAPVAALFGEYHRLFLTLSDQWARSARLP
jgi:Lon protease-like protein